MAQLHDDGSQPTSSNSPDSPSRSGRRRPRQRRQRSGCLFLIATCLFTCLLLILNAALVTALYSVLSPYAPAFVRNPKFAQLLMFVVPVVLIFVQWRLVDTIVNQFSRPRR